MTRDRRTLHSIKRTREEKANTATAELNATKRKATSEDDSIAERETGYSKKVKTASYKAPTIDTSFAGETIDLTTPVASPTLSNPLEAAMDEEDDPNTANARLNALKRKATSDDNSGAEGERQYSKKAKTASYKAPTIETSLDGECIDLTTPVASPKLLKPLEAVVAMEKTSQPSCCDPPQHSTPSAGDGVGQASSGADTQSFKASSISPPRSFRSRSSSFDSLFDEKPEQEIIDLTEESEVTNSATQATTHSPARPRPQHRQTNAIVVRTPEEESTMRVVLFDHRVAYEQLQEAKAKLAVLYAHKNQDHLDAHDAQGLAKEKEDQARVANTQGTTKRVLKRAALRHQDALRKHVEQEWAGEEMRGDENAFFADDDEEGATEWNDYYGEGLEDFHWGEDDPADRDALVVGSTNHDIESAVSKPAHYHRLTHSMVEDNDSDEEAAAYEDITNPDWKPTLSSSEALAKAQQAHKTAKKKTKDLWEEMRALRTKQIQLDKMVKVLMAQFPDLNTTVGSHQQKKTQQKQNPPSNPSIPPSKLPLIKTWHSTLLRTLTSHSTLQTFPLPPAWRCASYETCRIANESRGLAACAHNIRAACGELSKKELKKYSTLFHPDRFGAVEESVRKLWQGYAQEVFVVVNEMWKE